jgi:hypothetical protein
MRDKKGRRQRLNHTAAALVRAGLEMLPVAIAAHGERAGRGFIEFFSATIRNRNTPTAYARGKALLRLVRGPSPRAG